MTPDRARAHADEVRATSATILPGLIPIETIEAWNQAFQPLLRAAVARMLAKEEGLRRIADGEIPLEPVLMRRGDVMIRDVRHVHRGTPNPWPIPRPMVVIGYSRRWLFRPEVQIRVPRDVLNSLP